MLMAARMAYKYTIKSQKRRIACKGDSTCLAKVHDSDEAMKSGLEGLMVASETMDATTNVYTANRGDRTRIIDSY